MDCRKYFKPNQKVTLRFFTGGDEERATVISATIVEAMVDHLEVSLPYPARKGEVSAGLAPGSELLIISESYGLGTQVAGTVIDQVDETLLRIRHHGTLEVFFRRQHFRVEAEIGLNLKRTKASLTTLRAQWAAAVQRIAAGDIPPQMKTVTRQRVNLSAGGLALTLSRGVTSAELVPLLLDLGDGRGPICALGEVVWSRRGEGKMHVCGVRFVEIVFADKERINDFVIAELKKRGEDVLWYASRRKQLNKMEF